VFFSFKTSTKRSVIKSSPERNPTAVIRTNLNVLYDIIIVKNNRLDYYLWRFRITLSAARMIATPAASRGSQELSLAQNCCPPARMCLAATFNYRRLGEDVAI
jgi:hypothetical protein